jgi:hypothetical protein
MKLPKFYNVLRHFYVRLIFTVILICVPLIAFVPQETSAQGTSATVSEMKRIEEELKKTKEQRDKVNSKILSEQGNQSKLSKDAQYIESVIRQSELQEESIRLELQTLNLQIQMVQEDKKNTENQLGELQDKIENLSSEMQRSTNLLYKMSMGIPTFLEQNTNFEDTMIKQEQTKSIVQIIKSNIIEVKALESDVNLQKAEILKKENELLDFQSQKQAQTQNLELQQQGLAWQKQNKEKLIEQSKSQQSVLSLDKEALNIKIIEVEKKLNELRARALSLPASGTPVVAGQVIGQQGNTGYSTGSHLHFEYKLTAGGDRVNPEAYRSTFAFQPMDKMILTSGYGNRCFTYNGKQTCDFHTGSDYVNYFGAPIYAIKAGKVDYYCDSYGGLGAIVFHNDGSRSLYWHIQKVPGCKPLGSY